MPRTIPHTVFVPTHTIQSRIAFHAWIVIETLVAVVTLALIALAIYFFLSGTHILEANRERAGVRLSRFTIGSDMYVYGSFVARSDCTQVNVLTDTEEGVPVIYLTETEPSGCLAYTNPLPYTFTASIIPGYVGPVAVYMNGDRITTVEE
jgi:hypothetical protein